MISSILLLAVALSAGNADFDRTAAEGAAKIAARRAVATLAQKGAREGLLKDAMIANPNDFTTRGDAEKKCREIYVKETDKMFADECREIRRRLALPEDFPLSISDQDRAKLSANFGKAFNTERAQAIDIQAKTIVANIRPTETQFETVPEPQLKAKITDQIVNGQKTSVFEENKKYISDKIVDPMIAGAHAERRRQREYLVRARCDSFAPSALRKELAAKLNENVNLTRSKETDMTKAWGVFPSVINGDLPRAVERRTIDRLVAKVDTHKLNLDQAAVESVISKDPASHVKARESEQKFFEVYAKDILAKSLAEAIQTVPQAERDEVAKFLNEKQNEGDVKKAVERVVRREVMPKWRAARDAVSGKQIEKLWPKIADGSWFPSASMADETAARSDYSDAVRNWRTKIAGMKAMADMGNGKPVFEEVFGRVDKKIITEFDRARGAIAKQNSIVDAEGKSILAAYKAQKAQPTFPDVVTKLTDATGEKWYSARVQTLWPDNKVPINVEEQHTELFPSVKAKIDTVAKAIMQELSVKSKSDSTAAADADSDEEDTYSVEVMRMGGQVSLTLKQGKAPVFSKTVGAKMADFKKAMEQLAERIGKDYINIR